MLSENPTVASPAIIEQAQPSTILRDVEESAILAVWEQGKKHNIEFGRLCYEYSAKYGAQGSAGNGLAQFLRKHSINEGVAYYWIAEFKAKNGKGIPCPDCELTFPSKTKLSKHVSKRHPEVRPEVPAPVSVAESVSTDVVTDAVSDAAALCPDVSDILAKPEYAPASIEPISEPVPNPHWTDAPFTDEQNQTIHEICCMLAEYPRDQAAHMLTTIRLLVVEKRKNR